MKTFTVCLFASLAALACAEPPSGYNYNRPSGGGGGGGWSAGGGGGHGGGGGGGYSGGGGFGGGGGGGGFGGSGGGSLIPINDFGGSTNEGQNVDAQILEQVRQIILRSEASGGSGGLTSSYGIPSLKVVGVSLEGIRQAIQVAQYQQTQQGAPIPIAVVPGYNRGPATSYSRPSTSYGGPAPAPSSNYGAPSGGGWN